MYCADEDSESGQLVVPDCMRNQLLNDYHNDPTAGHIGIEKTIAEFSLISIAWDAHENYKLCKSVD